MSKLLSYQKLRATKENRFKNDCPPQCNKQHCDVCQFRNDKSKSIPIITVTSFSPEIVGRDFY